MEEDVRRDNVHKSKLKLLAFLEKNDTLAEPALNMLLTGKCATKEKLMVRESLFFEPESTKPFGRIPKYWMGERIVRVSNGNITPLDIKGMDKTNPAAVKQTFFYFTGLDQNTALPKKALEKSIADQVCTARAVQVGSRWQGWKGRALRADYTIDWRAGLQVGHHRRGEEDRACVRRHSPLPPGAEAGAQHDDGAALRQQVPD